MEAVKGKMIIYRLKLIACDAQKILLLLHQMVITSSLWLIPTPYRASSITLTWAGTISIKKDIQLNELVAVFFIASLT